MPLERNKVFKKGTQLDKGAGADFVEYYNDNNLISLAPKNDKGQFELKVVNREQLNLNCFLLYLEMPESHWISGVWPGGQLALHAQLDQWNEEVKTMSYPIISPVNMKGIVVLLIKVFQLSPSDELGFKFSYHLETKINVGETILCSGPTGQVKYDGYGSFTINGNEVRKKTKAIMFAGGSGICQIFSVIQAAVCSYDNLEIWLITSNKNKRDILFDDILQEMKNVSPDLNIYHTLTQYQLTTDGKWTGFRGRIRKVLIEKLKKLGLPAPSPDLVAFACGPDGFRETVKAQLLEAGYKEGEHIL